MNAGMTGSMEELVREALATGRLSDLPSRHFIKGRFVPSRSAATMETCDPGSGRPFATFAAGDAGDVDQAVQAAKEALRGNWGHAGPAERGRVLYRAAELIHNAAGRLAVVECLDSGKPLSEACGDVAGTARTFEYFAGGIEVPFGGNKQSGFGREKGMEALRSYCKIESVVARI